MTPIDGFTMSQWEWAQAAVPITISGKEEKLNRGAARIFNLLQGKTTQAEMGIQEFFNYRALCGAGGTDITTAYTSPVNGSTFIDPLFKVILYTTTASVEVGGINGYTHSWWRNYSDASSATTFAGFLKELNKLRRKAGRGPGGYPNLHLVDEDTAELYNQALARYHQNTSFKSADIPFDNVLFHGQPVVADEKMPDVAASSETQSETSGSWVMINSKFFQFKVDSDTNFAPTPFVKPENRLVLPKVETDEPLPLAA